MPNRRNKAAKIRAILTDNPEASANEIIQTLAAQRVRVAPSQVYNVKSTMANPKADGYADLFLAKKLADEMGGVEKARAARRKQFASLFFRSVGARDWTTVARARVICDLGLVMEP